MMLRDRAPDRSYVDRLWSGTSTPAEANGAVQQNSCGLLRASSQAPVPPLETPQIEIRSGSMASSRTVLSIAATTTLSMSSAPSEPLVHIGLFLGHWTANRK